MLLDEIEDAIGGLTGLAVKLVLEVRVYFAFYMLLGVLQFFFVNKSWACIKSIDPADMRLSTHFDFQYFRVASHLDKSLEFFQS